MMNARPVGPSANLTQPSVQTTMPPQQFGWPQGGAHMMDPHYMYNMGMYQQRMPFMMPPGMQGMQGMKGMPMSIPEQFLKKGESSRSKGKSKDRSKSRDRDRSRGKSRDKSRDRSRDRSRSRGKSRGRSRD